eukprot:CAMPEP_0181334484 /NCGR_PEP_ID=MMETSP1101-20121128/26289_1 /TAXON_ID=46948 /ORGANISM="Rhodomonas abbreviata, Strain Caron Lab Isolate" /LENGTH=381 /DNA_ID=CAMNT_0023444473 /DNA_START=121 /DNA_END=1262 /DNA_ORIENTATION=+
MTAKRWAVVAPAVIAVSLLLVGYGFVHQAVPQTVELFNWNSWNEEQQHLMHSASALTGRLSTARRTGSALQQKLGDISNLVMPQRHTIPMDQALAMLKVQKQMRHEDQVPHDRIEGAGDVAGLVDEQDEAMERNALQEPVEGADIDTSNLYENCEDGSLTVEDADLCQRRAQAIKMLTKSAVQSQIAKALAPPAKVAKAKTMTDAQRELVADAAIGKEYLERLRLLNQRKEGLALGMTKKAEKASMSGTSSLHALVKRALPLNKYEEKAPGGKSIKCTCNDHAAKGGYADGTVPACSCDGAPAIARGQKQHGQQLHSLKPALPVASSRAPGHPALPATASPSAVAQPHTTQHQKQHKKAKAHAKAPAKGELGALAAIVAAG